MNVRSHSGFEFAPLLAMPPRNTLDTFLSLVTLLTSMASTSSGKPFTGPLSCAGPDVSNQVLCPLQHHPRPSMATSSRYCPPLLRLSSPVTRIALAGSASRSVGTNSRPLTTWYMQNQQATRTSRKLSVLSLLSHNAGSFAYGFVPAGRLRVQAWRALPCDRWRKWIYLHDRRSERGHWGRSRLFPKRPCQNSRESTDGWRRRHIW